MAIDAATKANEWLTPAEAALRLERTPSTVRYLMERGQLRYKRTPLGRLVDPASVDEMIRARGGGEAA